MDAAPRHQCYVYEGAPSRNLSPLARALSEKLDANFRCMFLNSSPMVAGMRSYLAALGVDVELELSRGRLVLSSDRDHLVDGIFHVDKMLKGLSDALKSALDAGYEGLFATGDMSWELGSEQNLAKLMEYEWRLEDFFRTHPRLCGICQYHVNTLPADVIRRGVITHPGVFVNETLSLVNPHFEHPRYAPSSADAAD